MERKEDEELGGWSHGQKYTLGRREGSDTWLMDLLHKRPKVCFFLLIIIIPGAGEGTPSPGHPQGPPVLAQLPQQPAQNPAWPILHPL